MAKSPSAPSDFKKGSMDISAQTATFNAFWVVAKWGSIATLGTVFFLILWLVGGFHPLWAFALMAVAGGVLGAIF